MRKKELEQSLDKVQNPLNNIMQEMERDLELNQISSCTIMSFTNKKNSQKDS